MNKRQRGTLEALFQRPTRSDIRWAEFRSLLLALGADEVGRSGSRVAFLLDVGGGQEVLHLHRPHNPPELRKYQVEEARDFLAQLGITPESTR